MEAKSKKENRDARSYLKNLKIYYKNLSSSSSMKIARIYKNHKKFIIELKKLKKLSK